MVVKNKETPIKFIITIEKDEDGYFIASCPALQGCHSQGKTKEEAIANIKEAIHGYIASLRKNGEPIPNITEVQEIEVAA
jgi:antitoxin HicB